MNTTGPTLDEFTLAYLTCALWSTLDETNERGGEPMDKNYGLEDLAHELVALAVVDCKQFQGENADDIGTWDNDSHAFTTDEMAGHDFWLTRNGHGAGFWDGDWPDGANERLTEASEAFGEIDLYVGDDGLIYN